MGFLFACCLALLACQATASDSDSPIRAIFHEATSWLAQCGTGTAPSGDSPCLQNLAAALEATHIAVERPELFYTTDDGSQYDGQDVQDFCATTDTCLPAIFTTLSAYLDAEGDPMSPQRCGQLTGPRTAALLSTWATFMCIKDLDNSEVSQSCLKQTAFYLSTFRVSETVDNLFSAIVSADNTLSIRGLNRDPQICQRISDLDCCGISFFQFARALALQTCSIQLYEEMKDLLEVRCPALNINPRFTYHSAPQPHRTAKAFCSEAAYHLLSITSAADNDRHREAAAGQGMTNMWLGLTGQSNATGVTWTWDDGSPYNYNAFLPDDTPGTGALCAYMRVADGAWMTAACSTGAADAQPYGCSMRRYDFSDRHACKPLSGWSIDSDLYMTTPDTCGAAMEPEDETAASLVSNCPAPDLVARRIEGDCPVDGCELACTIYGVHLRAGELTPEAPVDAAGSPVALPGEAASRPRTNPSTLSSKLAIILSCVCLAVIIVTLMCCRMKSKGGWGGRSAAAGKREREAEFGEAHFVPRAASDVGMKAARGAVSPAKGAGKTTMGDIYDASESLKGTPSMHGAPERRNVSQTRMINPLHTGPEPPQK